MLQLLLSPSVQLLRWLLLLQRPPLGGAPVLNHLRRHLSSRLLAHLAHVLVEVGELLSAELRRHSLGVRHESSGLLRGSGALARRHGRAGEGESRGRESFELWWLDSVSCSRGEGSRRQSLTSPS